MPRAPLLPSATLRPAVVPAPDPHPAAQPRPRTTTTLLQHPLPRRRTPPPTQLSTAPVTTKETTGRTSTRTHHLRNYMSAATGNYVSVHRARTSFRKPNESVFSTLQETKPRRVHPAQTLAPTANAVRRSPGGGVAFEDVHFDRRRRRQQRHRILLRTRSAAAACPTTPQRVGRLGSWLIGVNIAPGRSSAGERSDEDLLAT
jgi:hypothetical protein